MFIKCFLFLFLCTSSFISQAMNLPVGVIKNMNGYYLSPLGKGDVSVVKIQDFKNFRDALFEVKNNDGLLTINLNNSLFEFDLNLFGFKDIEKLNFNTASYTNNTKLMHFDVQGFNLEDLGVNIIVKNGNILCNKTINDGDFITLKDKLFGRCLKNGLIEMRRFYFRDTNKNFNSIFGRTILAKEISLDQFQFNINNHQMKGMVKGSITKNLLVTFKGATWYEPQLERIKLKITKVKAGFLNVTNTFFKELKKMESVKFKVKKPFLYISLK